MHWSYSQLHPTIAPFMAEQTSPDRDLMVIRGHDQAVLYDVDLHVVSALFRLREGADRRVDMWFWCDRTGEFGCRSTRAIR
jgi:hypothetical protein